MKSVVFLAAALLFCAPAAAQTTDAAAKWSVSSDRLGFQPAGLSAPRRAGTAEYFETTEFSHQGEGVDTAIKYRSADQKVFATLYVYLPSFAHSGVQAIATDQAVRGNARSPNVRALGTGVAPAAGRPGVAVTADYDHYLGDNYSKAAFIKAGRWMLKLRVTGPEPRSAEVAAVMKALLDGLRFEGKIQPRPAAPLAAGECRATARPDSKVVGGGGEAVAFAMLDAAGQPAANAARGDQKPILARIGRNWCRTQVQVGGQKVTVLQATGKERANKSPAGESALLVLYSDGGGVLEVVREAKERKYLLLHHGIAEVNILDSYDGLPSLAQIGRFFAGDNPTSIRARVNLRPDGTTDVELPGSEAKDQ